MSSSINPKFRALFHDRRGVSAIEFALIGSLLAMLMLAAFDFGKAILQEIQLQEAVRAGGVYATNQPTDVGGIQNAVASALPSGWVLTGGGAAVGCKCLNPHDTPRRI